MADRRSVIVVDSTGAPLTSGTPGVQAFDAVTGAARPAPPVAHVAAAPGTWRVTPTADDETTGTVVLVDFGAGNLPRFAAFACFKADNSNQFWAVPIVGADGSPWAGAAPTWAGYTSTTPPTLTAMAGAATALYVARPSAADIAADVTGRIDGPAGSSQPYWTVDTEPASPWAAPSSGPLLDPAYDVVQFLDGKTAGAVVLAQGTNLFIGEVRSSERTTAPAVFALATGGPAPEQYLGGRRTALFRPTVQLVIRGPADDKQTGEALARAVFAWVHQRVVAPYVSWYSRDSAPSYLGTDSGQHGQWSINLECQYRASLS